MSRAIRRQQSSTPKAKEGPQRPPRLGGTRGPQQTRGAKPPTESKRKLRLAQPRWMGDISSELRKVSWPTPREAWRLTVIVIITMVGTAISLGLLDWIFSRLVALLVAV